MDESDGLDWMKMKRNSEKAGYRDGIDEGRKSNFQKSFDIGYKSGYKNGFKLGKIKGELNAKKDFNHSSLENTKRGNCLFCKDETFMDQSNEDKDRIQLCSTLEIISEIDKN